MVDADRRLRRHVHVAARHHDRECRAAEDRRRPARELLRHPVGDRCLRADAGVAPADHRNARRPVREAAAVHDRPAAVRIHIAAVRAVAERAVPDLCPGRPGNRRGDHVRHLAGAAGPGVPWPRTRHRAGHLGRHDRRRYRDRPAARRNPHRGLGLVLDLLHQRPDRHRRGVPDDDQGRRVAQPAGQRDRLDRDRDVYRGAVPARARSDPRQRGRLGERADRRSVRRLGDAVGRIRGRRNRPERTRCSI